MRPRTTIISVLAALSFTAGLQAKEKSVKIIEESVSFTGREAVYSGTLSKPEGMGPFPLVIMVSGMGLQDRNWVFAKGKYQMAKIISDHLNRSGIAVYRYDDRGYAASTGTSETLTGFDELAEDVYSAVTTLKKRPDIGRIGLLGHSLGGILSIMAAAEHPDIDFIITLSGSYQNGGDIMMEQARTLKRWKTSSQMPEEQVIANGEKFVRNWVSYSKGGSGLDTIKQILGDLVRYQISKMPPEVMAKNLETFRDTADLFRQSFEEALANYTSPHQMSFASYDPVTDFKKLACPVLVLFGQEDKHVVAGSNLPKVAGALPGSSLTDLAIRIIPGADHGYSNSELVKNGQMVPGVMEYIANWVNFRK